MLSVVFTVVGLGLWVRDRLKAEPTPAAVSSSSGEAPSRTAPTPGRGFLGDEVNQPAATPAEAQHRQGAPALPGHVPPGLQLPGRLLHCLRPAAVPQDRGGHRGDHPARRVRPPVHGNDRHRLGRHRPRFGGRAGLAQDPNGVVRAIHPRPTAVGRQRRLGDVCGLQAEIKRAGPCVGPALLLLNEYVFSRSGRTRGRCRDRPRGTPPSGPSLLRR